MIGGELIWTDGKNGWLLWALKLTSSQVYWYYSFWANTAGLVGRRMSKWQDGTRHDSVLGPARDRGTKCINHCSGPWANFDLVSCVVRWCWVMSGRICKMCILTYISCKYEALYNQIIEDRMQSHIIRNFGTGILKAEPSPCPIVGDLRNRFEYPLVI